jgi:hypothetical protein
MLRKKLKVETGKTYTVRDAVSTYTIIVGDVSESDSAPASPASDSSFAVGVGAPSLNLGRSGGVYLDSVSRKIYTKDAAGWDSGFDMGSSSSGSIGPTGPSGLDGSNGLGGLDGSNGSDGRTTIEGAGPPTSETVYAAALADAEIEASGVKNGDLYLDTLNHVFYKRASGAWVSRTSHTGRNGKTIFDGSGDPDDPTSEVSSDITDAAAGDLYHDVTNFKWYKRNSSGIPGERWDPRNSYKPGELKNISLATSFDLATAASSEWLTNSALAAVKENDTVLDPNNKRMYKRTSTGWEDQGSIAGSKGDKGDGGDNGQDGLNGSNGLPGSDGTGIYSTVLIAESGTPSSNTAYGTTGADDLLIDSTNHKIYKRSASGATFTWALQGVQFRGTAGATGPAAITGYLSNESHTVTANPDGTGYSTTGAGGTFYVNSGSSTVTAQNYYVGASGTSISAIQNKLTLSINSSGVYTLSGGSWDTDSESFTLRAISGSTTVTKSYNIVKNKSSKNLSLVAKALTFSKNGAGSFYPSGQSITLTPQMQNLSSTTITWTLKKIISGTPTTLALPNVSYITQTAGSSPYATLTSTQFNSATGGVVGAQLQITAAHADGIEDTVTIGVVSDGSETDIYCAALGTASSATDQRVPYDAVKGGGAGLRLSDVKADVGSILTAAEGSIVSYVSSLSSLAEGARPSASYSFHYDGGSNYTKTVNHRLDGEELTYTPTIFTIAVAGQYRITWQGSFRLNNFDTSLGRSSTCYMSLLKSKSASSDYDVIDEISVSLSCSSAATNKTTTKFSSLGGSSTSTLVDASATSKSGVLAWQNKNFIGKSYSDFEYVSKVTTLKLEVGDKITFKARKGTFTLMSYDPDTIDDYGLDYSYATVYRDVTEAWINANSAADEAADKDIDTIVMFQRVAD